MRRIASCPCAGNCAGQDRSQGCGPGCRAYDPPELADRQIQELYLLDTGNGDAHLAYYGQLRAKELSHVEAMLETVQFFSSLRVNPPAPLAEWLAAH